MTASTDVELLARESVTSLPLYAPDGAKCAVDLSDNTNLWGPPPAALAVLRAAASDTVSRYPSSYSEPLGEALLDYVGLRREDGISTLMGCGSDDVIDSTMRAFGAAGDRVAFSAPTFSMIPVLARLNGLSPTAIPFTQSLDVDAQRLVDCGAKLTYLCSPNNPTATAVSREAVEYVVAHAQGIVLIDEAYAEFAPETFTYLVSRSPRVLVARTFSKAFGLAGLRAGYAVGALSTVRLVERARGPYKVNSLAERAVQAALSPDGVAWVHAHAALAVENRVTLAARLEMLGLTALPSAANFLLVPTRRAEDLFHALVARGVLVRLLHGLPRDLEVLNASEGSALRIGVGPWDMMESLLAAIAEAQACA